MTAAIAQCPRCTGPYDAATPARSRVTLQRDISICPPCGTDEAARDARGMSPVPPGEWPL